MVGTESKDNDDTSFDSAGYGLSPLKKQILALEKEQNKHKTIINSLLMVPKKAEYIVAEVKKELIQKLECFKTEL